MAKSQIKKRRIDIGRSISPDEWQRIYRIQDGKCYICQKQLRNRYDKNSTGQTAALDHDHMLEAEMKRAGADPEHALRRSIRGVLCSYPCNKLLVRYWTLERLVRAREYLIRMPAQKILGDD